MPVAIDIAAERRAGPEERRTTGGLPYRVSRTNTPDLAELRRELDRQRGVPSAGRAPPAAPSPARAEHHSPRPPQEPRSRSPHKAALDGFAWIQEGLGVSLAGNRRLAPSNAPCGPFARAGQGGDARASAGLQPDGLRPQTAPGRGRPQSARRPTPSRSHGGGGGADPGATRVRPQTARPKSMSTDPSRASSSDMGAQQMPGGGSTSDPYADANLAQRTSGVQDHTLRQESRPALRPGAKHSEPPSAPASQHVLRDPMASLEGRWAEGLQGRIDARTAREREAQRSKLGAPQRTGAGDRHSQDPIVAAAANGAILPFSEHPAVTDPMRSVWKRKKFALDPTKTSAGLTQDLIKWSKFDNRYQKPRSPRSPRSRSPGARPKDSAQPESPGSKEAARREDEEVATAMHKVQEDLDSERKSDTARFHAMVRHGWTMPHRHYEDALHLDLRRGLSNAKKRLDEVILERDQFQASSNIMQHRWKALKERCESLEELLKLKQAEMMELDRETAKLRFLIGMREGEVAQLQRQLDHVNGLKGSLEDRLLFEQAPGGPPRPATPVMNEIDGSARSLIKDLTELEQDLHERIAMTEKMGSMVETVAVETKKRVLHEASLRPGVVEAETQTACELADMDLVCTLDEEVSVNEDPWLIMEKLRSAHRGKQRFQVGVPETFKDVVLDSRHWHRDRQERQEALLQNPTEMMCKLVSLFFSKMEKNEHDLVHLGSWPRNAAGGPMTHHIHECNLKAAGLKSGADLETMDLVAFLEHENFRANELVKVFARVCGMPVSSNEMELPQETQNYLLDVVFVLHEISHEHQKRAKMTAKQRSEMKALTDEQIFNKKFEPIGDDENALIQGLRTGESVSFKKAQVCKVIKQTMAHKACYTFNEGETLNFQEANKLMPLGDALEYAVQVYEEVRVKRLAFFKDAFRQISPSGKLSYAQLQDFILSIDPMRPVHEVEHMYREMCIRSGSSDRIDPTSFSQVLQEQQLDRPADYSLVLKGADPLRYAGLKDTAAATKGAKKGKSGKDAFGSSAPAGGGQSPLATAPNSKNTRPPTRIGLKNKKGS